MSERTERVDVAIVGGGPAGLATLLALHASAPHLAARAVVLEKAEYPREKYCAGAVGGRGDALLARWGARPEVPSATVYGMSIRTGGSERAALLDEPIGRVVRRFEYDAALAGLVRARGLRLETGVRVERVRAHERGAVLETSRGVFEARVVVGADGVGSAVRKAMGLGAGGLRAQVLELDTESVPSDRDRRLLHFDASERDFTGYYWDFPTIVGGRALVCRGAYHLRLVDDDGVDLQERLGRRLRALGLDLAAYKNKRFAERGFEPAERVVDGPLMLVGEAAGVDPVTGEGIAQGLEYGSLAGPFLRSVLAAERPLRDWSAVLGRSRLGRDLLVRRALVQGFYGPHRPAIERTLVRSGAALRAGAQHFGALATAPAAVGEAVARLSLYGVRNLLRPEATGPRPSERRAESAPPRPRARDEAARPSAG